MLWQRNFFSKIQRPFLIRLILSNKCFTSKQIKPAKQANPNLLLRYLVFVVRRQTLPYKFALFFLCLLLRSLFAREKVLCNRKTTNTHNTTAKRRNKGPARREASDLSEFSLDENFRKEKQNKEKTHERTEKETNKHTASRHFPDPCGSILVMRFGPTDGSPHRNVYDKPFWIA